VPGTKRKLVQILMLVSRGFIKIDIFVKV